jgi:hypothetical protein
MFIFLIIGDTSESDFSVHSTINTILDSSRNTRVDSSTQFYDIPESDYDDITIIIVWFFQIW